LEDGGFIDGCFLAGSSSFSRVFEGAVEVVAQLFKVVDPDSSNTDLGN